MKFLSAEASEIAEYQIINHNKTTVALHQLSENPQVIQAVSMFFRSPMTDKSTITYAIF